MKKLISKLLYKYRNRKHNKFLKQLNEMYPDSLSKFMEIHKFLKFDPDSVNYDLLIELRNHIDENLKYIKKQ